MNYFFHLAAGCEVCPGSPKELLPLKGSVPYLSVLPLCAPVPCLVLAMMCDAWPHGEPAHGDKAMKPFLSDLFSDSRVPWTTTHLQGQARRSSSRREVTDMGSWQGAGELGHLVAISCQVNLAVTSVRALILVPRCLKIEQTAFNYEECYFAEIPCPCGRAFCLHYRFSVRSVTS